MFENIKLHTGTPERPATNERNSDNQGKATREPGMNERIRKLRKLSVETQPSLSIERALHETAFYRENYGTCCVLRISWIIAKEKPSTWAKGN
jgi:hypothetical protein